MDKTATLNEKLKQGRILVVDDDIFLLETFNKGLSLRGYQCKTAMSANIALELLRKDLFDIMVIDVVLPDMKGFELTAKAKKIKPDMAIIIMTGFVDEFSYDDAMEVGAYDFIKKPFTIKELIARIKQIKMHEELQKREQELKKRVKELGEFYDMAISRELRMKQLKEEIAELKEELEEYKKS